MMLTEETHGGSGKKRLSTEQHTPSNRTPNVSIFDILSLIHRFFICYFPT
ncbi:MAG: hypothetical protein OXN25_05320 [Candidatus Poribacteria bacterium]|nr:hypothetical protein [Candidatus Poribacteria bacterium]